MDKNLSSKVRFDFLIKNRGIFFLLIGGFVLLLVYVVVQSSSFFSQDKTSSQTNTIANKEYKAGETYLSENNKFSFKVPENYILVKESICDFSSTDFSASRSEREPIKCLEEFTLNPTGEVKYAKTYSIAVISDYKNLKKSGRASSFSYDKTKEKWVEGGGGTDELGNDAWIYRDPETIKVGEYTIYTTIQGGSQGYKYYVIADEKSNKAFILDVALPKDGDIGDEMDEAKKTIFESLKFL